MKKVAAFSPEITVINNCVNDLALDDYIHHLFYLVVNVSTFLRFFTDLELQLEQQKKQQQVRTPVICPQSIKSKPSKRQTKRPRFQRPASTTTLSQQATMQPQQLTVLSPISLSSVGQPFTMTGLPIASIAQLSNTVTLLPAGSQFFTRYMVGGGGKQDTITLHPSSCLTQLGTMVSPLELVHLNQQSGSTEVLPLEGQVVDNTMLVQGGLDSSQEHTVIEINPTSGEQAVGVLELQLSRHSGPNQAALVVQREMEVTMAAKEEDTRCQMQEGQSNGFQGLQLDANGQLSNVQIVVIGENTQEENKED